MEGTPESNVDFSSKKDLELPGVTWEEALYLAKDRSEWRNCTARCAPVARERTKV